MQSPEGHEPPTSVWDIVCQYAAASEHHELRQLIGADLIDQTLELRRELELLHELMTEAAEGESPPSAPAATRLPEPPQMRERLTQEIVFFLESIRERARRSDVTADLKRLAVSQEVVDYAYESSSSRPSTGMSRLSLGEVRVTPCSSRAGSRTARSVTTARSGTTVAAEEDVAQMRDQLNYMRCDEVRKRLRQYLQEEIEALKEDLASLQEDVASGASSSIASARSHCREPTLAELRTERHKLEQALLSQAASPSFQAQTHHRLVAGAIVDAAHQLPSHGGFNKPANESILRQPSEQVATSKRPSSAQRLRSLVQQSRLQQPELLPTLANSE